MRHGAAGPVPAPRRSPAAAARWDAASCQCNCLGADNPAGRGVAAFSMIAAPFLRGAIARLFAEVRPLDARYVSTV